jgi:hypothetical protein
MNRRDWLRVSGRLGASCLLPAFGILPVLAEQARCRWETNITRLRLPPTWTTTMSSSEYRNTIQVVSQAIESAASARERAN